MEKIKRILEEEDPFVREIFDLGFDEFIEDKPSHRIILLDTVYKKGKQFDMKEFRNFTFSLTIISGVLPDLRLHMWISEGDGSAERFRHYILNGKDY